MAVRRKKSEQLANLGLICADRVRAAVRFKLKPAEIFSRSGLQIENHVEAVCMLPHPIRIGVFGIDLVE